MAKIFLSTPPWLYFHTLQVLFPNLPPLGLQIIGGVLKKEGHDVFIFDEQDLPPLSKELLSAIEEFKPDIIGFSISEIASATVLVRQASFLKNRFPEAKYIVGGHAPTFFPNLFLGEKKPFDAIVLYEGEETIAWIVQALLSDSLNEDVPGAAWADGSGRIIYSRKKKIIPDLNKMPYPYIEGSLKKSNFNEGFFACIESSRGCPFNCSFCSIPGFYGNKPRYKTKERIISEIEYLRKFGVAEFAFIDDSFATNVNLAKSVFREMLRRQIYMVFGVQIRADIVARNCDLVELGKRVGLSMAIVGFEGYTENVHEKSGKGNSAEINWKASRVLRENGVAVYGTHIFGSPGTSWKDNFCTFFKGRLNSDIFRMTIFTPVPGSSSFDKLKKNGRLNTSNPADFYEGKYVIDDEKNPFLLQAVYFGLLALHYLLPDTLVKIFARNNFIRKFMQRAYKGAFIFVFGKLKEFFSFVSLKT